MSNNPLIHPTAIIDPSAVIAADVKLAHIVLSGQMSLLVRVANFIHTWWWVAIRV